jgi:hypothetical protein
MDTQNLTPEAYERALERAHAQGVTIIDRVTFHATGVTFWIVLGSDGETVYHINDESLSCDCPAHGFCKHVALVIEQKRRMASRGWMYV